MLNMCSIVPRGKIFLPFVKISFLYRTKEKKEKNSTASGLLFLPKLFSLDQTEILHHMYTENRKKKRFILLFTHTVSSIKVDLCVFRPIVCSSREKTKKQQKNSHAINNWLRSGKNGCPCVSVLSIIKSNLRHILGLYIFCVNQRKKKKKNSTRKIHRLLILANSFMWIIIHREAHIHTQKKMRKIYFGSNFGHFQGKKRWCARVHISCKKWI